MATAGGRPATVPGITCSIPTERIQLLSTSLLYCGLSLRERGQRRFSGYIVSLLDAAIRYIIKINKEGEFA